VLAVMLSAFGCVPERGEPVEADERYQEGSRTEADDPIEYTEGEATVPDDPDGNVVDIQTILDIQDPGSPMDPDPAWYAFGSNFPYPQGSNASLDIPCETTFLNRAYELENELPATIRGVVTLEHHYEKVSLCGEDHRFYGVYTLQDETGTIMVLKDSRIADFTFGDRVEIEVLGLAKSFGRLMVVADRNEKILETDAATPYEALDQEFSTRMLGETYANELEQNPQVCWDYIGSYGVSKAFGVLPGFNRTYRVRGEVVTEPTSQNFNAMTLRREVNGENRFWTVSLGLELGRRGVGVETGDRVQATGPGSGRLIGFAPCQWQFNMIATSVGQVEILEDVSE
jgi:hypothetical protein